MGISKESKVTLGATHSIDTLRDIGKECQEIAHAHGWLSDDTQRNLLVLLALITSEVGEMVEAFRHPGYSEHIPNFSAAEEEGADILIRLLQMGAELHLDIAGATLAKMEFNRTRSYRHGGKLY